MTDASDPDTHEGNVDAQSSADFEHALGALVGKPVLWHISDPISGVLLYLGQRVDRARPISNTYLTEEQRRYVGDSSVFITCTWRIDTPPDLLPAPNEEMNEIDRWDAQLSVCVGKTLVCARTTPDRRQLQLQFDNETWLVADLSTSYRYQDYTIQVGDTNWTVEADGSLERELNES
jgi:hypothetical protein